MANLACIIHRKIKRICINILRGLLIILFFQETNLMNKMQGTNLGTTFGKGSPIHNIMVINGTITINEDQNTQGYTSKCRFFWGTFTGDFFIAKEFLWS